MSDQLFWWMDVRVDAQVLLFVAGAVALAALLAGTVPALQSSGVDVGDALREGGRGETGFRMGRLSRALVVGEVALSFALLAVSGLFIKSIVRGLDAGEGYDTENVVVAFYNLREAEYDDAGARLAFHQDIVGRLEAVPGVAHAALATHLPGLGMPRRRVEVEGRAYDAPDDRPWTPAVTVTPGFFEVVGAGLVRGRGFLPSDDDGAPKVAIVNTTFAAQEWPGEDPLGKRFRLGDDSEWITVVGVAPSLGLGAPTEGRDGGLYLPLAQHPAAGTYVAVRAASGLAPSTLLPAVRGAVSAVDGDVAVASLMTLGEKIREKRAGRVFAWLFLLFGFAALLLAAVGLYGVLAFGVSRRRREMGIRMALGATSARVAWLVARSGAWQVGVGVVVGAAVALPMAVVMGGAISGVSPRDPAVFGGVALAMVLVGVVASAVPARRAVGVEVGEVMRE